AKTLLSLPVIDPIQNYDPTRHYYQVYNSAGAHVNVPYQTRYFGDSAVQYYNEPVYRLLDIDPMLDTLTFFDSPWRLPGWYGPSDNLVFQTGLAGVKVNGAVITYDSTFFTWQSNVMRAGNGGNDSTAVGDTLPPYVSGGVSVLAVNQPAPVIPGTQIFHLPAPGLPAPGPFPANPSPQPAPPSVPTLPTGQAVLINNGQKQRSQVTSITIIFSGLVNVRSGALTLRQVGGHTIHLKVKVRVVNGHTVVVLTFRTDNLNPQALADGNYALRIDG